jgi:hypothetical protein
MASNSNVIEAFDADRIAQIARVQVAMPITENWDTPVSLIPEQTPFPYPLNALPSGLGLSLIHI